MKENLCVGCMNNKGTAEVCPHCGYTENTLRIPTYLAPRSVLGSRYLVGRVLSYNGEGVTYIGYDTVLDRKVEIREYFPDALAVRAEDGCSVNVRQGCQIAFKANMSDFIEVKEKLSRIHTLSCIQQVWSVVEENQTVYAIQERMEGTLLRDHLQQHGPMYTWDEAAELLLPMIRTLGLIHQEGIIHRGVSPSTVWVGKNGSIKLGCFSISAVRAAHTELPAELFPGYSAPEQYSTVSPHGVWTDVYGVSALLYTCVTGQCPPEALVRSSVRELSPPRECNETVPPRISLAILQGLSISTNDRIRTLSDLVGRISAPVQSGGDTITIPTAKPAASGIGRGASRPISAAQTQTIPVSRITTVKASDSTTKKRGSTVHGTSDRRLLINSMLITLPILLLVLIFTFWYLFGDRRDKNGPSENVSMPHESSMVSDMETPASSEPSSVRPSTSWPSAPESETVSVPAKQMVSLVGMQYEDVLNNADYAALFTLEEPEYIFSETDEEGTIVWQSVSAYSDIRPEDTVRVKVSKGSQFIDIPFYDKCTMEEYTAMLDELDIRYIIAFQEDTPYPAGFVAGYSSPSGNRYDTVKKPVIQVFVSSRK